MKGLKKLKRPHNPPYEQKPLPEGMRRCHDCGRPTPDYRCRSCWQKKRGYAQDGVEWRTGGMDDEIFSLGRINP